jgi:hypothetical protein
MKKKIDLSSPLTPEEQEWEDSIDPNAKKITDPAFLAEARAGLDRLRERRTHGGARANSGRKPKEKIITSLNLSPAAKARLKELAKQQPGGMSAVVNRLILADFP